MSKGFHAQTAAEVAESKIFYQFFKRTLRAISLPEYEKIYEEVQKECSQVQNYVVECSVALLLTIFILTHSFTVCSSCIIPTDLKDCRTPECPKLFCD